MAVQLLSQATGYGVIVGLSVLFCLIILTAVRIQKWYLSEDSDESEMVCLLIGKKVPFAFILTLSSSWSPTAPSARD